VATKCEEIEMLEKMGRTDLLYEEVTSFCNFERGRQPKKGIANANELLLKDSNDITKGY